MVASYELVFKTEVLKGAKITEVSKITVFFFFLSITLLLRPTAVSLPDITP